MSKDDKKPGKRKPAVGKNLPKREKREAEKKQRVEDWKKDGKK